jgi:hypothetical protein
MRQPANSPAASNVILTLIAALPDEALRPLLLRLLLQNGAAAPRETSDASRRPGWPKGKPRGKRKASASAQPSTSAQPTAAAKVERSNLMANAAAAGARLAAQRLRDARLKREKRAAAREGKANGANGAHTTNVAATLSATPAADPGAAERARHANVMRPEGPAMPQGRPTARRTAPPPPRPLLRSGRKPKRWGPARHSSS